jgi:hypothetical protein
MRKMLIAAVILVGLAIASVLVQAAGPTSFGDSPDRDRIHAGP